MYILMRLTDYKQYEMFKRFFHYRGLDLESIGVMSPRGPAHNILYTIHSNFNFDLLERPILGDLY